MILYQERVIEVARYDARLCFDYVLEAVHNVDTPAS